ncbi:hypothetical protein EC836_107195 [Erwinia sp. JUb26]|nr:hypothetical protein EC836_107195 [Erwinia sp. JUb26]
MTFPLNTHSIIHPEQHSAPGFSATCRLLLPALPLVNF